jgi:predicted RND superfamily exporter protein
MIINPSLSIYGLVKFFKSKTFLILVIIVIALGFGRSCAKVRDSERQNKINEQNIAALKDTIRMERTKSGTLEATVAGFISSVKDLKKLNEDLYKEVKDQKGNVISLNKIIFQLKQDTSELRSHINYLESIMSQPIQINDSVYCIPWVLNYDWDFTNFDIYKGETTIGIVAKQSVSLSILKGSMPLKFDNGFNGLFELKHYNTEIIERTTQIDMSFGQEIVDDQLRVFVATKYPGFTPMSMKGWMIDPNTDPDIKKLMKKKKWIPNTFSVGFGPSIGYNLLTFKPYLGVGVNINYNILQW